MKLKKGDTVVVITGKDKGKQGEVQRVLPSADKVIVTRRQHAPTKHAKARKQPTSRAGIIDKRHADPRHQRGARPQGQAGAHRLRGQATTARRCASPASAAARRRMSDE